MRLSFSVCLLVQLLSAASFAVETDDTQVHRWVDVYGNVHYDDRMPEEETAPVTFTAGKERVLRIFRTDPFLEGDVFPEHEEPDDNLRQLYTLPWGWKVTKKTDRLIEYGRSGHPGGSPRRSSATSPRGSGWRTWRAPSRGATPVRTAE